MMSLVIILFFMQSWLSDSINPTNLKCPPTQDGPVAVSLGIYVLGISEINEKKMDYTISMYYRESWRDKRIRLDKNSSLHVQINQYKKYWLPDIFLRNEKQSFIHHLMTDNTMFKISPDGITWHVMKITSVLACPMNFQRFPFDSQHCSIFFESFSHTMATLYLKWLNVPVQIANDLNIPKYEIKDNLLYDCSQNYSTGSYPCLEIRFILTRKLFYAINGFFLPTIFTVLMAWLSFFIDLNNTVHRIVLSSLGLFLTLVLHKGIKADLPLTGYLTAADLWTIICISIILCTIVVHVVVNWLLNTVRKPQKAEVEVEKVEDDEKPKEIKKTDKFISDLKNILLGDGLLGRSDDIKSKQKAKHLNAVSRIVVALVFVLVIIIYFCFFTFLFF